MEEMEISFPEAIKESVIQIGQTIREYEKRIEELEQRVEELEQENLELKYKLKEFANSVMNIGSAIISEYFSESGAEKSENQEQ
jgi:exonuclease VII small subunit